MSQTTAEYNVKAPTFLAGEAFPQYASVKFNGSGKLVKCGASDECRMVANREAFAANDPVSVTLVHQAGFVKMIASEAISAEALCYAAADGEVASSGTIVVGQVVPLAGRPNSGAATADQDIIVVAPHLDAGAPGVYIPAAAQQDLSGAGAVTVTEFYTAWTTTSADAGTLADGTRVGQLKKIQLVVDGGDGTLTPSNLAGGTTITFADAGDYALLMWDGDDWVVLELGNDADGATAPTLA